jgi:hypothetical protein
MNELLLLLAAAAMIGAAIYLGQQGLMLRGINQTLRGVVESLEQSKRPYVEAENDAKIYGSGWLRVDKDGNTERVDPRTIAIKVNAK